ncbi:unnamed protein product [Trichobilharzia szidati]|nr:unnamed protein product [Trichobilharzia szidati]
MTNVILKASLCLQLLLSNNNASNENFEYDNDSEYFEYDNDSEYDENEFTSYYDPNSTLDAYADSYRQVVNYKFRMIELETYLDPEKVEEIIKPEILRLEHLYQSKWAKEFLENAYRKAVEEDIAFQHKSFANKRLYHLMKVHISKKWENRKNLDIAEGKFFAKTSGNLKKYKVQIAMIKNYLIEGNKKMNTFKANLKALETAAVVASNAYRSTSTYLRGVEKGISRNDSLNDAEITRAYWKARTDFAKATAAGK